MNRRSYRRSTCATVRTDVLRKNWDAIQALLPPATKILALVKANGYGHGIVEASLEFQKLGAVGVGVADVSEGLLLRESHFGGQIICLGTLTEDACLAAADHDLVVSVFSPHLLEGVARAAADAAKPMRIHIKVETGMHRLGLDSADWNSAGDSLRKMRNVQVEGIFTHFSESENVDRSFTQEQLGEFHKAIEIFERFLGKRLIRHATNSGGIFNHTEAHLDWVRSGLALYGYAPNLSHPAAEQLRPALEWTAPVVQIKRIATGESVGYSRAFRAPAPMKIGTVAVGYGDGFHRSYASAGVGFRNRRIPVLGMICMDQMMVDLTDFPDAQPGDVVTLLGDGSTGPSARELAKTFRSIPYEVLTSIGARISRRWEK